MNQSINQSTNQSINQPINQSINQKEKISNNQLINQSIDQWINQSEGKEYFLLKIVVTRRVVIEGWRIRDVFQLQKPGNPDHGFWHAGIVMPQTSMFRAVGDFRSVFKTTYRENKKTYTFQSPIIQNITWWSPISIAYQLVCGMYCEPIWWKVVYK